jgi:hypothetical protein
MSSSIRPNRTEISRSFPVLGFTVHTHTSPGWFEVALATDPALFAASAAATRTASTFWTSRGTGMVAAERGEAIFLVPGDVLARFAGTPRLYYALATFDNPAGRVPELVVPVGAIAPYVALSGSFTGTTRRLRTGPTSVPAFSSVPASFAWAGDAAQPGQVEKVPVAAAAPVGSANGATAMPAAPAHAAALDYNDGFNAAFWEQAFAADGDASSSAQGDPEQFGIDGPPPEDAGADDDAHTRDAISSALEDPDYSGATRFVAAHPTNFRRGRPAGTTVDRIVIHITDARTTSSTVNWFSSQHPPGRASSAHYLVGRDGEVVQMVHEADTAYHARGANSRGIGIEHVGTRGLAPTEEEYAASVALVRDLAARYLIPLDRTHVVGHNEVNHDHPDCPTVVWDWDHYVDLLVPPTSIDQMGDFPLPSGDSAPAAFGAGWALDEGPRNWGATVPSESVPIGSYGDTWAMLQAPDSGPELHIGGTIAWRYNNPGNIRPGRRASYPRAVNIGLPSGFALFPTYAEGRLALHDLLRSRRYGPLQLVQMFWMYLGMKPEVPSDQGDPEQYARNVIAQTRLDGTRTVDSLDDSELDVVMDAIEQQEGYRAAGQRPAQTYRRGAAGVPAQWAALLGGAAPADAGVPTNAGTPTDAGAPADAGATAQALEGGTSFDFTWPDVELVAQPTDWSCWAASASMVVGWRDRVSINSAEIAAGTAHWVPYADVKKGLYPSDIDELAVAWRLTAQPPQSYSVEGFRALMASHGPLWIGVAVPSGHAIVAYGMYGDGMPSSTKVRVLDPWPPGRGERYDMTFADLEAEYEAMMTTDAGGNVNLQILSAADTGGRTPVSGAVAQSLEAAGSAMHVTTSSGTTGTTAWTLDRGDGAYCPWGEDAQCGPADGFRTHTLTVHGAEVTPGAASGGPGDFVVTWRTNGRAVSDVLITPAAVGADAAPPTRVRAEIMPRPEAAVPNPGDAPCAAVAVRFTFAADAARGETVLSLFGTGDLRAEAEWRRL